MLINFSGLPGTGKSTLARELARKLRAVWLRIDTVEHALSHCHMQPPEDIADGGYAACYALATDNLRLGHVVIGDSVNAIPITRAAWHDAARKAGVACVDVLTICSDQAEHRQRVETRDVGIAGFEKPGWQDVLDREFAPWDNKAVITIDTAGRSIAACLNELETAISSRCVIQI